jgi:hypothetical protein
MNNDFSELEDQLRKLRPAQPSPELTTRIERALAGPEVSTSAAGVLPRDRRFHFNWWHLGLGLAAATALLFFAFVRLHQEAVRAPRTASTTPAPAISTAQLMPAGLTQVVYRTHDEGLRFPSGSTQPMRRVRSHSRETLQWRNPKTGATLRISYPTEQVSLSPVSGQ